MADKHERDARAYSRKPQMNFEASDAEKAFFNRIAKARDMKLAALIRELLHDEGRRIGLSIDDSAQKDEERRRKLRLLIGKKADEE